MEHAGFIYGAYGAAAIIVAGLVAWIVLEGRRLQRSLGELEARGVRRRSSATASAKEPA
jgi:heme exporter protein D